MPPTKRRCSRFVAACSAASAADLFRDDLVAQAGRPGLVRRLQQHLDRAPQVHLARCARPLPGHEVIDRSLVDPDNRRPVDYAALAGQLASLEALDPVDCGALASAPHDGRAKLWIAWRLLALRREIPALFRDGDYRGLRAVGAQANHVVAFVRRHDKALLVAIAGRLFARLLGEPGRMPCGDAVWGDTAVEVGLADGTRLRNVVDGAMLVVEGGRLTIGAAFARFPAAALVVVD